jgi:hypothetical protein
MSIELTGAKYLGFHLGLSVDAAMNFATALEKLRARSAYWRCQNKLVFCLYWCFVVLLQK